MSTKNFNYGVIELNKLQSMDVGYTLDVRQNGNNINSISLKYTIDDKEYKKDIQKTSQWNRCDFKELVETITTNITDFFTEKSNNYICSNFSHACVCDDPYETLSEERDHGIHIDQDKQLRSYVKDSYKCGKYHLYQAVDTALKNDMSYAYSKKWIEQVNKKLDGVILYRGVYITKGMLDSVIKAWREENKNRSESKWDKNKLIEKMIKQEV